MIETLMAMEPWTIATFIGASFLLYLTPGADMRFTIASRVSVGPRAGLAAAAGMTLGVLTHVIAAPAGLAAEKVRKSAGTMNKVSAVIFGGLAARLAIN